MVTKFGGDLLTSNPSMPTVTRVLEEEGTDSASETPSDEVMASRNFGPVPAPGMKVTVEKTDPSDESSTDEAMKEKIERAKLAAYLSDMHQRKLMY